MSSIYDDVRFGSALPLLLFTTVITLGGCDEGGAPPPTGPAPPENGAVSVSLARTAAGDVPDDADSAIVRVWRPDQGLSSNRVKLADIDSERHTPASLEGATLEVPANTGYWAGLLAVRSEEFDPNFDKKVLAHGAAGPFRVQSGDTSTVALDLRPAEVKLEAPPVLSAGQTDTISATYGLNPPDMHPALAAHQNSDPDFFYPAGSLLDDVSGLATATDTSVSAGFKITAPSVRSRDTTYVKVIVILGNRAWEPEARELANSYFPSESGPSFEIPVVP